jgi:hypothetical protein
MVHEVFISHSSDDNAAAREMCLVLESAGIQCWIAPRDIVPGRSWSGAIVDGIEGSRVVVVVISARANASHEVLREVELASRRGKAVVGVRIEDFTPSGDLGYFLLSTQWLNVFPPPFRPHLHTLVEVVARQLGVEERMPEAKQPPAPEFVEVNLDDFGRRRPRKGIVQRLFEDR